VVLWSVQLVERGYMELAHVERGSVERAARRTWFHGACSTWNVVLWSVQLVERGAWSVQHVERGSMERAARGTWF
jgi:hypothetical protein